MADDNPLSWGAKPVAPAEDDPTSWGAKRVEGPGYLDYAKDIGKQVLSAPVRVAEGAATWPAQVLNLAGEGVEAVFGAGNPERVAEREKLRELIAKQGGDKGVGQYLPKAETLPGKYAGTIADFALGAATSPGRLAITVPAAVTGAVTSETAGQLAETAGPIAEGAARIIGAVAGTGGVLGGVGLARNFTSKGGAEIAQARLTKAFTRDSDTPDAALQRLAQVREVRPDATLVDVAGPEVRNVLELVTQSPGPAKAVTIPFLEGRQRGQMNRLVSDLTQATGSQRTAFRAIEETMAARRTAATPLYQQAYADGDREIWSTTLEQLSAAPFVRSAMRKAVTTWQNQAIADGYGAMNPTMVDRGGLITFGQSIPAFPNIQFWDYTKRMLDDMTSSALRAGQNQKARTLTTLTQQLRADLDGQVGSYAAARNAWAGPSRYLEAIEDGRSILSKNMTSEELAATFQGMGEAEREAYRIGAVSAIRNTMGSNAAKLPDHTRAIRAPEMRAKLEVIMPSPEAAQRFNRALDYEIQSAATANQALTGSATARRLAAMEDANNLVGQLAMAALPHKLGGTGLWSLVTGPFKQAHGRLRRQSEERMARTLTSPYPASALAQGAPQPGYVQGAVTGTGLGLVSTPLQGDQNAQQVPRQAGGGVPAIGGTGGRSPGAREVARAGAARGGTSQALPDGGEEGDGQAREIVLSLADGGEVQQQPPAPRERFAAALQGTPTGAGFGGVGGQQSKPKPAKTMSREDIRRTLQSFGITGEEAGGFAERQLGEVDSRAEGGAVKRTKGSVHYSKGMKERRCGLCRYYSNHKCEKVQGYIGPGMWCELFERTKGYARGGGVDDPSGERSPIHYDPADDTTFGARFGEWDQTATGKSFPRDEEDVDTSIMVPGQKMIHGGGYEGERGAAGYYMTRGMQEGGRVGTLPPEGEDKAGWPLRAIVLGPEDKPIPFPYRDKLQVETGRAQINPITTTRYDQPQQWLRFKRDQLQDFMQNTPPPTGGVERTYGMLERRQPKPQINYAVGPSTLEDRGEQPSVLAEQLGYRSLTAPRARAGPPDERIPLPRPRPYQDGGEVGDNPLRITVRPQLPDALVDQTRSYLADQIGGVDREHEQQDPHEALIDDLGGRKHPQGEGGSDEGGDPFEATAARTRRRAPVRAPDPASLAASQGKVGFGDIARDKLEKGIKTVTAPGRAYKEGMTDDEMIEASQGLAGIMGGARLPAVAAGKAEGSLGTFGGRNAKTADLDALAWATKKRAEGAPRASIWNQTGWWRMPDAQWAFEIPDRGSFVKPTESIRLLPGEMSRPSLVQKGRLGDVLHHPELYKAYPELAQIPTEVKLGSGPGGGYLPPDPFAQVRNPGGAKDLGKIQVEARRSEEHPRAVHREEKTEDITPWRVLLHETMHGIQHTQEPTWATGGNPHNLPYTPRQITNIAKKEAEEAGVPWWALRPTQQRELEEIIRKQEYQQLWGEMLPRMVERRRFNELGQRPPWEDLDLPWDKKIRIHANDASRMGFTSGKGRSPWKKPEKFADGGGLDEAPVDEVAEAQAAREAAAARTGHRGRQEGATTSFLDSALPVWMRAAAQKPLAYPEAAKAMGNMLASIPERMWNAGQQAAFGAGTEEEGDQIDPSGPGDLVMLGLGSRMPVKAAPGEVVLGAGRRRPPPPRRPASEVGEAPPARSHNLPPGEEPLPLERRVSSLSLRDMPLDKAIEQAKTERHLIPSRVKEGYVGAPNWVKTPEDLARLRANFDAQVERGLLGAKWYEEAQGGIREMAGNDPRRMHQLSQELALTSAQSTPDTNLGFALQGHNAIAAGKPLSVVRTGQQAKTMREGHAAGEMHLGRKTGIYARHMDPTMENPATGTNDIWHARALGYPEEGSSLGAAQHAFMDAETVLAVARANEKKLGGRDDWTPGEIQAAPWVAGKAKGLQEQFGWTPERSLAEAIKTYPQFFNKYTAFGTHEATPGIGVGHLPGIATGTEAERAAFAANPASSWKDPYTGEDIMYRAAGMYTRPTLKATGIFDRPATATDPGGLEVNPAEVARPMVSFKGKAGSRELGTADRALMTGVEAARAFVDAQNAGAFSVPIWNQKGVDSRSVYIPRPDGVPPGPMPLGDVKQLLAIGGRRGLPAAIDYGQGTAMTSFGGEGAATGKEIAAGLRPKGALGQELRTALPGTEPGRVKLDTGYIDYQTLDADRPRKKRPGWDRPEGSGEVTRELQKRLSSKQAPDLIANLDADPSIRMAVADRIHRDIQLAEKAGHPIREDLMRARQIIVEDGFAGLFEALKRGVALPAAAVVPALELLRQLQGQEQSSGG